MSIKNKFENRNSTCTEECKYSVHMQTEGVQTLMLILAGFHIIILLAFLPGDKANINLLFPWGKGYCIAGFPGGATTGENCSITSVYRFLQLFNPAFKCNV